MLVKNQEIKNGWNMRMRTIYEGNTFTWKKMKKENRWQLMEAKKRKLSE